MIRQIIKIDREKCNGCGLCVTACQEGAIRINNGKAELIRDDYCDGLGNCLPVCPTDAISFEEREALEFDEAAVKADRQNKSGCPGSHSEKIKPSQNSPSKSAPAESRLTQWPVQIKLMPYASDYYNNADLLIAADCTAYAYGNFHNDFIGGHVTVIGCPKLDDTDYSEKLTSILQNNNIRSIRVARMEVPCCGGIEYAAKKAVENSGKEIPVEITVISRDGKILR